MWQTCTSVSTTTKVLGLLWRGSVSLAVLVSEYMNGKNDSNNYSEPCAGQGLVCSLYGCMFVCAHVLWLRPTQNPLMEPPVQNRWCRGKGLVVCYPPWWRCGQPSVGCGAHWWDEGRGWWRDSSYWGPDRLCTHTHTLLLDTHIYFAPSLEVA